LSSPDDPQFEQQRSVSVDPDVVTDGEPPSSRAWTIAPIPPRDPVWSGWDVLLIALLTIVTIIVAEFLTVCVAWIFFHRHNGFRELLQTPSLDLLGEVFGYVAVALYMIMLVEGKYHAPFWKAIRWNWNSRAVPKLLLLGVFTVTLDLLGRYLPMPKTSPFEQFFARPSDAYLMAAFAVTFGPLMEELFFRGFLYPVLERRTGVTLAILLTALPFGLMHYLQYRSWGAVLVITCVGIVLTTVRVVAKSVAASFLVHAGYNATLMFFAAVATDGFRHMDKAGY
jgi:membrane protease YdiL (CAAX protease family)